jgi:hypothetical protein
VEVLVKINWIKGRRTLDGTPLAAHGNAPLRIYILVR